MDKTYRDAQVGDSVTYRNAQNQTFSGKVVIKMPTHVVINVGGRGTPKCVDDSNFVKMRRGKNRRVASDMFKFM